MEEAALTLPMSSQQNWRLTEVVEQEQTRLRNFIRSRVPNVLDAEDILQDVFHELVEANVRLMPIEHVSGWMFQVARNRITDLFRKIKPDSLADPVGGGDGEERVLEDLLPSPDDGPDAAYARKAVLAELERALHELPEEQRKVFIAHEVEGRSFNDLVAESGVGLNTLLSRKRYAVLYLRERLQGAYEDFRRKED
jgi:RNA polymerase sigma factor (sigma-70 family)